MKLSESALAVKELPQGQALPMATLGIFLLARSRVFCQKRPQWQSGDLLRGSPTTGNSQHGLLARFWMLSESALAVKEPLQGQAQPLATLGIFSGALQGAFPEIAVALRSRNSRRFLLVRFEV